MSDNTVQTQHTQNIPTVQTPSAPTDYCSNFTAGGCADRIAGLVFGHALGDAVGLTTEFCETPPDEIEFPYSESIRKIRPCDWTDDTDLLVLTIGSLMENNMRFISKDLASRFVYWCHKGLIYTGDTEPKTPNNTFKYIVGKRDYIESPVNIANAVLIESKGTLCNNSPLTRMVIAGTVSDPVTMSKDLCTMTHTDTRCIASCVFLSCVVNSLIYNVEHTSQNITDYITAAKKAALVHLDEPHREDFGKVIDNALRARIGDFKLGELSKASSVYKCLSCVVYALHVVRSTLTVQEKTGKKSYPDFKKCIMKIALEGGDADANCAMVGSILGCWMGYKKLPREWICAMPNSGALSQFVAVYISRLFAPTTMEDNAAAAMNNDATNGAAINGLVNTTVNTAESVDTSPTEPERAHSGAPVNISSVIIDPITDGLN